MCACKMGRYSGFHICDLTQMRHSSYESGIWTFSVSDPGMNSSSTCATPSRLACCTTDVAILAEISRISLTCGRRPPLESVRMGDWEARLSTQAAIMFFVIYWARDSTAPRPIPGNVKQLLFSEISRPSTGGKGEPVATSALPFVHLITSLGIASCKQ